MFIIRIDIKIVNSIFLGKRLHWTSSSPTQDFPWFHIPVNGSKVESKNKKYSCHGETIGRAERFLFAFPTKKLVVSSPHLFEEEAIKSEEIDQIMKKQMKNL